MVAKKTAPIEYTPIGDSISLESAYIQAVTALDLAAAYAQDSKDPGIMLQVAELYIALGNNLIPHPGMEDDEEDEDEIDLEAEVYPPVGFGPPTPREVAQDGDEG